MMTGIRLTSSALTPTLAIVAVALVSLYDGQLTSVLNLLVLVTAGMVLLAWKTSVGGQLAACEELTLTPEQIAARKPLLYLFFGFYAAWFIALGSLWYFDIPQLFPAMVAVWLIRKELWCKLFFSDSDQSTTVATWIRSRNLLIACLSIYLSMCALMFLAQRSILFIPSHTDEPTQLEPWLQAGETIGYCREVLGPQHVWLMMHGNAGQASMRDYVLPCMSPQDALYVLEYPGYGSRPGRPSRKAFNQAAADAYRMLRERFPNSPVGVIGESIGSGPASALANENNPPDKIVLLVPFDSLVQVVNKRFFWLPVRALLLDQWNNIEALKNYHGPVDIFAARDDEVISVQHARNLCTRIPNAQFIEITGGHNDWSRNAAVRIRGNH